MLGWYKDASARRTWPALTASPTPSILARIESGRVLAFNMADIEKNDATHIAHVDIAGIAADDKNSINNKAIVNAAEDRNEFDHKLTIKDAVRYYKWAIIWCLAISMTVVMEGYDTYVLIKCFSIVAACANSCIASSSET